MRNAFATLNKNAMMNSSSANGTRPRFSVCVFCASSNGSDPAFLAQATALGQAIAARGWQLVYGGAQVGLMGALADAALAGGAPVIGVIPQALVSHEIAHRGLTELIEVASMHQRKAEMERRADAFIALPGGLGTLDELCEALTWALLGIHQKPILLINTAGYWNAFLTLLDAAVENGFLRATHRGVARVVDTPAQAFAMLDQLWVNPDQAGDYMMDRQR
jgi:uncharacterized protein (TIGR00730 family)